MICVSDFVYQISTDKLCPMSFNELKTCSLSRKSVFHYQSINQLDTIDTIDTHSVHIICKNCLYMHG